MALSQSALGVPGSTIYIRNLEERIKPEPLKEALKNVFSDYGNILDLVAKKNLKAKGQAFVVFDSALAAKRAVEDVQGFELFEKPMKIDFARTISDATVSREGNDEEYQVHKRRRLAEKERKRAVQVADMANKLKRTGAETSSRPVKASKGAGLKPSSASVGAVIPEEYLPPNKILFVQNLPDDYGVDALTGIFGRFEGLKEIRLVPGRKGIAFVEYEAEAGAISAKENTQGMILGDEERHLKVVYQRQ